MVVGTNLHQIKISGCVSSVRPSSRSRLGRSSGLCQGGIIATVPSPVGSHNTAGKVYSMYLIFFKTFKCHIVINSQLHYVPDNPPHQWMQPRHADLLFGRCRIGTGQGLCPKPDLPPSSAVCQSCISGETLKQWNSSEVPSRCCAFGFSLKTSTW